MEVSELLWERLAASKEAADAQSAEDGSIIGAEWAHDCAEFEQLRRLAAMRREGRLAVTDAEDMANVLSDDVLPPDEACDFWENLIGDRYPSEVFVRAFAQSALDAVGDSGLLNS